MSVLYLHFDDPRAGHPGSRSSSGAARASSSPSRAGPASTRWPRRKSRTRSRSTSRTPPRTALETADYLAKAKETQGDAALPPPRSADRLDIVKKRLPNALFVTEQELSETLAEIERRGAREGAPEEGGGGRGAQGRAGQGRRGPRGLPVGKPAPPRQGPKKAAAPQGRRPKKKPAPPPKKKPAARKHRARVPKKK